MFSALLFAAAAPTYLQCELQIEGKAEPVELSVDEATGRATVRTGTGRVLERSAAFSPKSVTIPDHPTVLTVDRVSLSLRRDWPTVSDASPEVGKCQLAKHPAERAF